MGTNSELPYCEVSSIPHLNSSRRRIFALRFYDSKIKRWHLIRSCMNEWWRVAHRREGRGMKYHAHVWDSPPCPVLCSWREPHGYSSWLLRLVQALVCLSRPATVYLSSVCTYTFSYFLFLLCPVLSCRNSTIGLLTIGQLRPTSCVRIPIYEPYICSKILLNFTISDSTFYILYFIPIYSCLFWMPIKLFRDCFLSNFAKSWAFFIQS